MKMVEKRCGGFGVCNSEDWLVKRDIEVEFTPPGATPSSPQTGR
jgi:hypothetical protein